jgi:hypothetical protein
MGALSNKVCPENEQSPTKPPSSKLSKPACEPRKSASRRQPVQELAQRSQHRLADPVRDHVQRSARIPLLPAQRKQRAPQAPSHLNLNTLHGPIRRNDQRREGVAGRDRAGSKRRILHTQLLRCQGQCRRLQMTLPMRAKVNPNPTT